MILPARRIGGSDISALMDCNPYRDSLDVFNRIVLGFDQPSSPRMERGNREEPRVRGMYVERTGAKLEPHPGIIQSKRYEFATISPDDIATVDGERICLEYKTVSIWTAKSWGDDGSDMVPQHYALQAYWSLAVNEIQRGHLFAAFGEDLSDGSFDIKFCRLYPLFVRDLDIEAAMYARADAFWRNHVLVGVPPERTLKPKKKRTKQGATP